PQNPKTPLVFSWNNLQLISSKKHYSINFLVSTLFKCYQSNCNSLTSPWITILGILADFIKPPIIFVDFKGLVITCFLAILEEGRRLNF
ncbi:MAG: hypothetical protein ACKO96_47015, partial [Flammeovirgaceae bacterium]